MHSVLDTYIQVPMGHPKWSTTWINECKTQKSLVGEDDLSHQYLKSSWNHGSLKETKQRIENMESRGAPAFKELVKMRRKWNLGGQRQRVSEEEVISVSCVRVKNQS